MMKPTVLARDMCTKEKRVSAVSGISTMVALPTILVVIRAGMCSADLNLIRRDYKQSHLQRTDSSKSEDTGIHGGNSPAPLLEKKLLPSEATNSHDITIETMVATVS